MRHQRTIGGLILGALVLASFVALHAAARPDFSGAWTLSLGRSQLDPRVGAGLERGHVQIAQSSVRFALRRVFIAGGKEDQDGYDLPLDGTETTAKDGQFLRHSRLTWEGDVLVLSERIAAPMGEATNTVRYRLLDGGRTLEARERFLGPRLQYENLWVFEKAAK